MHPFEFARCQQQASCWRCQCARPTACLQCSLVMYAGGHTLDHTSLAFRLLTPAKSVRLIRLLNQSRNSQAAVKISSGTAAAVGGKHAWVGARGGHLGGGADSSTDEALLSSCVLQQTLFPVTRGIAEGGRGGWGDSTTSQPTRSAHSRPTTARRLPSLLPKAYCCSSFLE